MTFILGYIRSIVIVTFLFLSFFSLFSLFANVEDPYQKYYEKIDKVDHTNINVLLDLLDPSVRVVPKMKSRAIERLGFLYRNYYIELTKRNEKKLVISALNRVLKSYDESKIGSVKYFSFGYKIRSTACDELHSFSKSQDILLIEPLLPILNKIIQEDKSIPVVVSCVHALSFFASDKNIQEEIIAILTTRLETIVENMVQTEEDITILSAIINSLGKTKNFLSFIPLVKVIQSAYPRQVKDIASRALLEL